MGKLNQKCMWQPIETAPRGGTRILIAVPANDPSGFVVGEAYCNERRGGWWWANLSYDDDYADPIRGTPTHWMPLPQAPRASPQPLQDDADAPVPVIKDAGPPDNAGAPAARSAFDRDGEVSHGE